MFFQSCSDLTLLLCLTPEEGDHSSRDKNNQSQWGKKEAFFSWNVSEPLQTREAKYRNMEQNLDLTNLDFNELLDLANRFRQPKLKIYL